MTRKLKGTLEQLQAVVEMTGASGQWTEKGSGHWHFRANDGAILNWWASSGTITCQGPEQERQELEQILDLALARALQENGAASAPTKAAKAELGPVKPMQLGRYRHYKGKEYEVIGVARHSETLEELVVYRALYGERGLWVRPRGMFTEKVRVGGREVARFEWAGS